MGVLSILSIMFFSLSLLILSRSAKMRARARADLYYALQIEENITSLENLKKLEDLSDIDNRNKGLSESQNRELTESKVELKEVELDQEALEYVQQFQPKQQEIEIVDVYEDDSKAWFNFPEIDLLMKDRPENGLYYVAGKVLEVLDEFSAIISDGTGERLLYHKKVRHLNVGDVLITQVQIDDNVWNFVNVWEVNEAYQEQPAAV